MMSPACLLLLVLPLASAINFNWGPCPSPSVQANFTFQRFMGKWYEIESLPNPLETSQCVEANFLVDVYGKAVVIFTSTVDNRVEKIEGSVHQDIGEPAKLQISHYYCEPSPWWVLATDYTNVAAIYSCTSILNYFHLESIWIASRTRSLPPEVVQEAKMVFQRNNIDVSKLVPADQTGC
uniref:Apolipoprotein D n=1 Tax=Myripristis murdjan TaxID=586833 RepID=A0A667X6T5_9TELE